jgi:hypothetical protein
MNSCILLAIALVGIGGDSVSDRFPSAIFKNPGFESNDPLDGWQLVTYGSEARVTLDGDAHHGHHALRVSAEEPSDTALGQELDLQPYGWYRFTGWVKTRGLDPMNARSTARTRSNDRGARARSPGGRVIEEIPTGVASLLYFRLRLTEGSGSLPSWSASARAGERPGSMRWPLSRSTRARPRWS